MAEAKAKVSTIRPDSLEMGLSTMEELRRRDQIGDGFELRNQTDRAVGRGLDLGFTGDSSLRPSAWTWRE